MCVRFSRERKSERIERKFKTQNPNHRLTHIGGMALGLMSVVVLVWADVEDGKGGVSAGGKRVITQYYYITLCSIKVAQWKNGFLKNFTIQQI